ncbi:hypothetical protein ACPB8Q_05020 [Methanocaldococcus indicus]|uniref:hypothetical protein n=1 Tax=Methanocaldococcus indicus TaxID=213231 RepID=UPI003C6D402E
MAVAPAIYLIIEFIIIAIVYWMVTPVFNYFIQLAQINGWTPEVTSVIVWVWKLFPLILIFGTIIGYFLWVSRKDVTSGPIV